ncbi:c4 protein [Cowpea golden mosaic virus]|uniref:C4 protein n=1 Tax=Cowpea golden mosaic virus TaxID=69263 RepID=O55380_9GEMI|nr:c4 protein [Cowpea golden mosaic virus-[Nigeria]]AAB87610.1 c4 protein [Cowpea golden mosaic virus-[Nigeria]]
MGNLICTYCYNSKVSSRSQIQDCSTLSLETDLPCFIQTFREQNRAPTSSPISRRMETPSHGANSRSMEDLAEEDNNQPTTLTPQQLTLEVRRRLSTL